MINYIRDLHARYQFWKARKLKLDVDYKFYLDIENPESFSVMILKKYPETILSYSNIEINDGFLSFEFSVVSNPRNHDVKSKSFDKFNRMIMMSIIDGAIKTAKVIDESRTIDTSEFAEERDIFEESDSVLEERVPERKPRKKSVRRNKSVRSKVQSDAE